MVSHCSWKHLLAVKEEREQETETYLLSFYEMKILEIKKTSPPVSAKVMAGCRLLEPPRSLIVITHAPSKV